MPSEKVLKTLEQIAAHGNRAFAMGPFGSNIRSENYRPAGIPVIRGVNLSDIEGLPFTSDDFVFVSEEKADDLLAANAFPGDLVFVAQGNVGKVGLVPANRGYDRYVLSQNLMKVTVDTTIADPRFVYYCFRSPAGQHEILSRVNSTGVPMH